MCQLATTDLQPLVLDASGTTLGQLTRGEASRAVTFAAAVFLLYAFTAFAPLVLTQSVA